MKTTQKKFDFLLFDTNFANMKIAELIEIYKEFFGGEPEEDSEYLDQIELCQSPSIDEVITSLQKIKHDNQDARLTLTIDSYNDDTSIQINKICLMQPEEIISEIKGFLKQREIRANKAKIAADKKLAAEKKAYEKLKKKFG